MLAYIYIYIFQSHGLSMIYVCSENSLFRDVDVLDAKLQQMGIQVYTVFLKPSMHETYISFWLPDAERSSTYPRV